METYDSQPRGWEESPDLLQSVWRYKWLIAVAALLGGLVGYGWAIRQPTLYQASSAVLLTGTASPSLSGEAPAPPIGDPERYIQNQAVLIGTTPVLELAAEKSNGKASVDDLRQRMNVEVEQDKDVITISVFDGSPSTAAVLANAIAEAYEAYVEGQPRQMADQLRSNITKLEARLAQVNLELATASNDSSLQRRRDALVEQLNQIERDLAAAEADVGVNLVQLELAIPPEQPAEPAPRRTMAVGLLVGLLISVALAWLLNSRRTAQDARTEWERSGPPEALPASGHELAPENQGWAVAPESFVLASRRPDTVVTKNGRRGHSAVGRLMWRFRDRRNLNEPTSNLNEVAAQEGARAFHRVVDEKLSTKVSENGDETSLSSLFVRLDRTLAKEPLDFYSNNLPQATVEELYAEVSSDMVVILLDDGEGSFRVAGSIGLDPGEQDAIVDQGHEQLRQALWNGVSVLYGADALGAAAGIPGSQTLEGLLIMPLVQGRTWLGMLLIGRRGSQRQHAIPFSDQEIADALLCAMELSALIQALLLAKRLRECMGAFEP